MSLSNKKITNKLEKAEKEERIEDRLARDVDLFIKTGEWKKAIITINKLIKYIRKEIDWTEQGLDIAELLFKKDWANKGLAQNAAQGAWENYKREFDGRISLLKKELDILEKLKSREYVGKVHDSLNMLMEYQKAKTFANNLLYLLDRYYSKESVRKLRFGL